MSTFRHSFLALSLLIAGPASAALVPSINVVELTDSNLIFPAHEADTIKIRPCQTCDPVAITFTKATQFRVGGFDAQPVSLNEFRTAARQARKRKTNAELLIYVTYDVDDSTVKNFVFTVMGQ